MYSDCSVASMTRRSRSPTPSRRHGEGKRLPPYQYTTNNVTKVGTRQRNARNLVATRLYRCPVVYSSHYVMNSQRSRSPAFRPEITKALVSSTASNVRALSRVRGQRGGGLGRVLSNSAEVIPMWRGICAPTVSVPQERSVGAQRPLPHYSCLRSPLRYPPSSHPSRHARSRSPGDNKPHFAALEFLIESNRFENLFPREIRRATVSANQRLEASGEFALAPFRTNPPCAPRFRTPPRFPG